MVWIVGVHDEALISPLDFTLPDSQARRECLRGAECLVYVLIAAQDVGAVVGDVDRRVLPQPSEIRQCVSVRADFSRMRCGELPRPAPSSVTSRAEIPLATLYTV